MKTTVNIMKSLLKAQAECLTLPLLDDKKNSHSNYTFISYSKLISLIMPVLHKHDLAYFVTTECDKETHATIIQCSLYDTKSDEEITSSFSFSATEQFPVMNRAQTFGSYLTYCKKYCLCAMLGIDVGDADEDKFTKKHNSETAPTSYVKKNSVINKPVISFDNI